MAAGSVHGCTHDLLYKVGHRQYTGANLDLFLNVGPIFMNKNGTGSNAEATPPRMDIAGPTPRL